MEEPYHAAAIYHVFMNYMLGVKIQFNVNWIIIVIIQVNSAYVPSTICGYVRGPKKPKKTKKTKGKFKKNHFHPLR